MDIHVENPAKSVDGLGITGEKRFSQKRKGGMSLEWTAERNPDREYNFRIREFGAGRFAVVSDSERFGRAAGKVQGLLELGGAL